MTGTVKFFSEVLGYGFIRDDNSETEYFVHKSGLAVETVLTKGSHVSFELEGSRDVRGDKATNVQNI
jgi:CspA family cold shock protein